MFGKQVLPLGHAGGPALVAYVYEREVTLGYNQTLAVVTIAEFLSLLASLMIAAVGVGYLFIGSTGVPELRLVQISVLAVAAGVFFLAFVFWYRRGLVERGVLMLAGIVVHTLGRVWPPLAVRLEPARLRAGLARYYEMVDEILTHRRSVLMGLGLSLLGWGFFVVPLYTSALALGIQVSAPLVLFIVPISGLATIIPLPGGLGGIEVAVGAMLFALTGIDLVTVVAIVLLFRLCTYWFMVLVGGLASVYSVASVGELEANTMAEELS
jgi:uncharacterized protein (TIRG00374 family)